MKIFIPIKEVSQRVPGKNFRNFGGKPLYAYTLDKLKDYKVWIDTDSDELIDKLPKLYNNVVVYRRKPALCGHDVSVNYLIRNWVDYNLSGVKEDEILVQLHVTSPFLKPSTVLNAIHCMKQETQDSMASVSKIQQRLWRLDRTNCPIAINHDPNQLIQTQNLDSIYGENSLFYIFTKKSFNICNHRFSGKRGFYSVGYPEDMDIDTEDNWDLCVNLSNIYWQS